MPIPSIRLNVPTRPATRNYMHANEQGILLALVNSVRPRVMVEVGVNIGLTAMACLHGVPTIEKYFGIDVDPHYRFEIPAQQCEYPGEPGRLVKDDLRFELALRGGVMPTYADVMFIDGDHGRKAVLADSLWAAEIVAHGGMIIWHDYQNPTVQVTEVLDELHDNGRNLYQISDTWLVFERR